MLWGALVNEQVPLHYWYLLRSVVESHCPLVARALLSLALINASLPPQAGRALCPLHKLEKEGVVGSPGGGGGAHGQVIFARREEGQRLTTHSWPGFLQAEVPEPPGNA